jgi:hypothetical protein
MRTEKECLAMAAQLDQRASRCGASAVQASYFAMARTWRWIAEQARWQDALPVSTFKTLAAK